MTLTSIENIENLNISRKESKVGEKEKPIPQEEEKKDEQSIEPLLKVNLCTFRYCRTEVLDFVFKSLSVARCDKFCL